MTQPPQDNTAAASAPGKRQPRRAQRLSNAIPESAATPQSLRPQEPRKATREDAVYQRYLRDKPPHWA
ncbi:hypothetical protein EII31_07050 [Leucobacter sp. OH2974_COT-288]|nr:hypothetical protein EII31_07050 [Leucobacter sp. OH2974_COT-288]